MKMRANELKTWESARKGGALWYSVRTGTIATLIVLALYIGTNAYYNYDELANYIKLNFVINWLFTLTVSLITYVSLIILSLILYFFNEYRYKQTIQN